MLMLVVNDELNWPGDLPHRSTVELLRTLGCMYLLGTVIVCSTDWVALVLVRTTKGIEIPKISRATRQTMKQVLFDIIIVFIITFTLCTI